MLVNIKTLERQTEKERDRETKTERETETERERQRWSDKGQQRERDNQRHNWKRVIQIYLNDLILRRDLYGLLALFQGCEDSVPSPATGRRRQTHPVDPSSQVIHDTRGAFSPSSIIGTQPTLSIHHWLTSMPDRIGGSKNDS